MPFEFLQRNSFVWVFLEEFHQHRSKLMRNKTNNPIQNVLNFCLFDVFLDFLFGVKLVIFKGILSKSQFKHKNSDCPNVNFLPVSSFKCFRSSILESAHESKNWIIFLNNHFRKSIVCQFYMAFISNQYVLWLQLSVNYSFFMQNLDCYNNFGNKLFYDLFSKNVLFSLQVVIKISIGHILHHKINFVFILESLSNRRKK